MVFSAYSQWTYDPADVGLSNYCAKPPFDCAFVLLILNWVGKPISLFNPELAGGLARDDRLHVLYYVLRSLLYCQECLEVNETKERTSIMCYKLL